MNAKLALSFSLAAVILAAGGFLAVLTRLDDLRSDRPAPVHTGRPPGVVPPGSPGGEPTASPADTAPPAPGPAVPFEDQDLAAKLQTILDRIQEVDSNGYDYYTDVSQDLFALKREVRQLKATLRQIVQGLGRGGTTLTGSGVGLAPRGESLSPETLQAYRNAAAAHGVRVEDGRVTVRGFLNMSPNASMPIEYFMTRFPESGHETLVHLVGDKDLESIGDGSPYAALKGLCTALYQGLVAAGFHEGAPAHPDPDADPKDATWILATGDVVYVGVRYELDGREHVARATDWVIDPDTGTVLPQDCFRFTGSSRGEDPDTGEEMLAAEALGLVVSVWPSAAALVEVALPSAIKNDYAYNHRRIPKPARDRILYLDVIFSKTPIETAGDGARPIEPPAPPEGGPEDGADR